MWILIYVLLNLEGDSLQYSPEVNAIARYSNESTCLATLDRIVKEEGYQYKINKATGEKYISKVVDENRVATESVGFCERVLANP